MIQEFYEISFGVKKPQENTVETSKSSIGGHAQSLQGCCRFRDVFAARNLETNLMQRQARYQVRAFF